MGWRPLASTFHNPPRPPPSVEANTIVLPSEVEAGVQAALPTTSRDGPPSGETVAIAGWKPLPYSTRSPAQPAAFRPRVKGTTWEPAAPAASPTQTDRKSVV